ncbi:MAG TPA: acyl-CoA dehydrogenase family protein [Candidatus Binatia bacterium]|jgi:alkylation response protein AidB-like acyl-CoA dehydrogenase
MAQPKNFGFGPDEQMVRDQASRFLKDNLPVDRLRTLVAHDHHSAYESPVQPVAWDQKLWRDAVALGWTGLGIPEDDGGVALPLVALASVVEEAGRAAFPSPLLSTLCATEVLKACETAAAHAALAEIAGGAAASLATTGEAASWETADADVTATSIDHGFVLDGVAHFVQDARKAAFFVVSAQSKGGAILARVAADAPGVSVDPDRIADLTRDQASVRLQGVDVKPDHVVAPAKLADEALAKALPSILTLVAADICGAGEWQLQTTTEYARTRKQFDHAIGFFQAVKHPIVNMMLDLDRARSLVYAAACAVDHEPADALRLARMAKAAASDAAKFLSGRSIQLHGGIGFTWECDVHIWVKRQQHSQFLWGDATWHRARLAEAY